MTKHLLRNIALGVLLALMGCQSTTRQTVADTRPFRLVTGGWKSSWSPDGNQLVYGRPNGTGLDILDLRTGACRSLTDTGKDAAWSPDGRHIAFVREPHFNETDKEEVWLISPQGDQACRLCAGGFPSWATNGTTLYVRDQNERKLVAYDIDRLDENPVVVCDGLPTWYPSFSPDGWSIAFLSEGWLNILNIQRGRTDAIWPIEGESGILASWTPDGRYVAFGGYDYSSLGAWIVDVHSRKGTQLAEGSFTMPAWTCKGDRLALDLRQGDKWEVWVFSKQWVEARLAGSVLVFSLDDVAQQAGHPTTQ
jgi:Tol biopolymer transport system component